MSKPCLLVGDIGGTNARFAMATPVGMGLAGAGFAEEVSLRCADFGTVEESIEHYLRTVDAAPPDVVCLAAAGPVVDGAVQMTNNHWHLRQASLERRFAPGRVRILNDFEAIAWALPHLTDEHCAPVGSSAPPNLSRADFSVGVIGPGTGLGAAALISRAGGRTSLVTEAGHVGFAPETRLQTEVWQWLRHRYERVSDERLVSGPALADIFTALCEIRGAAVRRLDAAGIFERYRLGADAVAIEAVHLMFEIFGQVAGNFALALGAWQGIYLTGGIVQKQGDLLRRSGFREAFEAKGRHRALMQRIPTLVISHPQPGLLGASAVAARCSR